MNRTPCTFTTRTLNVNNLPQGATHVATNKKYGHKFWVYENDGAWWILPSPVYSIGYAYCSCGPSFDIRTIKEEFDGVESVRPNQDS